jgi:glycosyltransferase EpsF
MSVFGLLLNATTQLSQTQSVRRSQRWARRTRAGRGSADPVIRVLHVVGRMDRAGAETMLMNYYRAIDRDRYQFDFLVFTADRCDYDEEIESLGGRIVRIEGTSWMTRTIELTRLLRRGEWVAIHSHTNFSNMFPLFAAFLARIPVRISHAHVTDYVRGSFLEHVYRAAAPLAIRMFSTNRVACGHVAGRLLYSARDRVSIIPNAIPTERFMLDRETVNARVRCALGIGPGTMLLLQVGRLDPVKNQRFTLQLAKTMKSRNADFAILLVGRGGLESELRQTIEESGLTSHVRLLGVREDVPELLNAANLFILPSLVEGFPVVLVEAQAAGVACLVSARVSPEVDLGMGLIKFLPVPAQVPSHESDCCVTNWLDVLLEQSSKRPPSVKERLEILQSNGYSVSSATERLTRMYDEANSGT